MIDVILDTLLDALKLLPFLFLTFLLMEVIEHNLNKKNKKVIENSGKFGPAIGGILGAIPQCGFSVAATNLYAIKIVSMGTLISIYLSTSDEMLPVMLSGGMNLIDVLKIIGIKVVIGIFFGFIIDFIMKKDAIKNEINDFCSDEHCDCKHGIIKSSVKHTLKTLLFIMLVSFILNLGFEYLGEETISNMFMKDSIFGPVLASLIGLIPNCGASVVITELYLNGVISFGSLLAGLLTGSGVAILVLFRLNKNLKENIQVLLTIYGIGVLMGIIFDLFNIVI